MENESSIKEIIRNSLEQVRTIIDADTIVGKQIVTSSGMVIIPISKLSMGFASGGLDLPTKNDDGGKKNFGGGGGTGVSVVPVGFLTITPEGKVDMIPMTSEKLTPVEVVADLIYNSPDIIGRIKNVIQNGYQESTSNTDVDVDVDVDVQPELADEYREQLILEADAPVLDSEVAAETEQILYADEGERYADTKVGRRELKLRIKEQKKRDKEAAKLQKKADKSAAKMARIQAELMALNMALEAAQTPEEKEYIQSAITEAKIEQQLEGEKQAEIVTQQKALAAAAPVQSTSAAYEIQTQKARKTRDLTPDESLAQLEAEIRAFNAALAAASTLEEQQRIIDVERDRIAYYSAAPSAPSRSDVEINEFNRAMQAARTPAQKQAVIETEKRAMLQPSTARVKTPEQMQFAAEMNTLDTAYRAARSDDEKRAILDVQKQTIINAKKRNNSSVDKIAREVQAFNAAYAAAYTPRDKHAIIQAEKKAMLQAGAPVLSRDQQTFQSEMTALNNQYSHATTPAQQAAIIEAEKQAIIKAKKSKARGTYNPVEEKYMADVVAFNAAYNAARTPADKYALINAQRQAMPAPVYQQQAPIYTQVPVRTIEQESFAREMNRLNNAYTVAAAPAQQQVVMEQQKQAIVKAKKQGVTVTKSRDVAKVEKEVQAFLNAYNAQPTAQQKQAVIANETAQMLTPVYTQAPVYAQIPVETAEQKHFATEMSNLDRAYTVAATPAQQAAVVEQQKQVVVNAKKQGITVTKSRSVAAVEKEVQAFLAAYNAQPTAQQKQAVVAAEVTQMLAPEVPVSEFETKMAQYDAAMAAAQTPEQQQVIVDGAKQTLLKEKRVQKGLPKNYDAANSRLYAEVLKFNAALAAAQTPEAKQAIIETEKKAMLQPQKAQKYTEFEAEMSDLNTALANAKTRTEQNQLLEEQKDAIISAKKRGLTKNEDDEQLVKGIAAFNAALLAAENAEQQQKLIDIEKRALLKAQKEIEVKNAEQEVFEAEMSGYDEAYAAAQSDLEKLTILEAQKQAIIKAKKKGVTKAQKAAKAGKEATEQQARLDILEAELVALKTALARAESELEKKALIDAEKDALIEAKKQMALEEGAIATEAEIAEAVVEPVTKTDKRADRKAKKLAKKQTDEEEAPIPHGKRGKISEKTLDSGTVK